MSNIIMRYRYFIMLADKTYGRMADKYTFSNRLCLEMSFVMYTLILKSHGFQANDELGGI